MYCSYHPANVARGQCASCARPVCSACDHRIKGFTYCQDCIVMGISMLARERHKTSRPKGKARLAALCGVALPGLGAVYNRQNIKAVVHFVTTIALFQLTALNMLEPFFVLGGLGFYLYTIIDAYRTARAIADGESAASNEERFKRQLARLSPTIGMVAIACGVLFVLQSLQPFGLNLVRLLPVGLILLGGYLLTRYFKRSREGDYKSDYTRPPYALIPGRFSDQNNHESGQSSRFSGRR